MNIPYPDFDEHAKIFFTKYKDSPETYTQHNFVTDALIYAKAQDDFIDKDRLVADVLVSSLEKEGFLQYVGKFYDIRHHKITQKGIEFLSNT